MVDTASPNSQHLMTLRWMDAYLDIPASTWWCVTFTAVAYVAAVGVHAYFTWRGGGGHGCDGEEGYETDFNSDDVVVQGDRVREQQQQPRRRGDARARF